MSRLLATIDSAPEAAAGRVDKVPLFCGVAGAGNGKVLASPGNGRIACSCLSTVAAEEF